MRLLVVTIGFGGVVALLGTLLLADRRRRLRVALEVLGQLDDERRARKAAERRVARLERELETRNEESERASKQEARVSETDAVRALVRSAVPPGAGPIAVVSRGDDELVQFEGHVGWHFPQTDDGVYAGYHPADSDAAIRELEDVRRRGARYLLIPTSSSWWLDHYVGFRDYLRSRYPFSEPGAGVSALIELTPRPEARPARGSEPSTSTRAPTTGGR